MPGVPGLKRAPAQRTGAAPVTIPPVCELPVPPLPAGRSWTERESARWEELWSGAAANLWTEDALGVVAVYVVLESQMLNGRITAGVLGEFRMIAEQLAMTPTARARMNVRIEDAQ